MHNAKLAIALSTLALVACAPVSEEDEHDVSLDDDVGAVDDGKADGLLRRGLHPRADAALRAIRRPVRIDGARISQTIGRFGASAGTHEADGAVSGRPYSGATDLRIGDLDEDEVRVLLEQLAAGGFAAWYRDPGSDGWPGDLARHVHAVYAGCPLKASLRRQVDDFLEGKNGLAGHATYGFHQPSASHLEVVRALYTENN